MFAGFLALHNISTSIHEKVCPFLFSYCYPIKPLDHMLDKKVLSRYMSHFFILDEQRAKGGRK